MKIVNFNVNGIRARPHQMEMIIDKYAPEIICLQEIKCQNADMPSYEHRGYQSYINGQKAHHGVAILSRVPIVSHSNGFADEELDIEARVIQVELESGGERCVVVNVYCPNGENRSVERKFSFKQKFYSKLIKNISDIQSKTKHLVVMGDMNIAPFDDDIGIGEQNAKRWLQQGHCAFLPEEREWMGAVFGTGLVDIYDRFVKERDGEAKKYSWFDYRSRAFEKPEKPGLRIDMMLGSGLFVDNLKNIDLDYEIRAMEKPSDHVPLIGEFEI